MKGDARDRLSSIFKDNPHLPPSVQYRNDLNKLDGTSFASGNLTGASVSKMAYQKIASDARCKANSIDSLRRDVDNLTEEFKELDEKECLEKAQTHRTDFGYIHKALIDKDRLEIILIDQVMAALYRENVKNDIIYIDATGSVTNKIKRLGRILYYAVVIRHPYEKLLLYPFVNSYQVVTTNMQLGPS